VYINHVVQLVETGGLDTVTNVCRIKITGLLPEDAEFTPVASTSSSTPDLTKKSSNVFLLLCAPCRLWGCIAHCPWPQVVKPGLR